MFFLVLDTSGITDRKETSIWFCFFLNGGIYRSFTPNCFITGFSCLLSFVELSRFFGIAPVSFHVFGAVIGE